MRTITDHKLNGLNEALKIQVLDEPGQGGANHVYSIMATSLTPLVRIPLDSTINPDGSHTFQAALINFQNGPIQEAGVNGVSGEALLAIVIDRLRSFQAGQYACRENALALTALEESLMWLQKRTRDRLARGVEGTNQK